MIVPRIISVGQPHPFVGSRALGEGVMLSLMPGDFCIVAIWDKPTRHEVQNFKNGGISLGLVPAGEHTFFLMMRIGRGEWGDMPFALGALRPEERNVLAPRDPDAGYLVHAELIDLTSHIVHGMRTFTVTPQFSQLLDEQITKLRGNLAAFTAAKHHAEITELYRRYPTSAAMVTGAMIIETAGMKFPR